MSAGPTRRGFLAGLAAASGVPRLGWAAAGAPTHLAAAREADGGFALFGLTASGEDAFRIPLPARGHAGAAHPTRAEAVVFARRPGAYALVIDCVTGSVLRRLAPPPGSHFNGHGAFAAGGALLATVEQRAEDSAGRLGLWAADEGYRRIGETPTGGVGPHEVRLLPHGATFAVANGGIATDPESRAKLNLATMRPNLAYLTIEGGLEEVVDLAPDLHRNSIRHLAVAPDDAVAFAMQWEGPPDAAPPLAGLHRRGAPPALMTAPGPEARAMAGYAGSIAFDGAGGAFAITSPRGGRVHRFDAAGGFLGATARPDVCGIAPRPGGWLTSDGLGGLLALEDAAPRPLRLAPRAWDNHLVALSEV